MKILFRNEYGLTKCFHAGAIYVFTQLCKMLILTFFPETISSDPNAFNFIAVSLQPARAWPNFKIFQYFSIGNTSLLSWSPRLHRSHFCFIKNSRKKFFQAPHSCCRLGLSWNYFIKGADFVEGSWCWILMDLHTKITRS